ncbi:MAG: PD-(D/E)XK nuclease family protein [Anaerolineales bacterium]
MSPIKRFPFTPILGWSMSRYDMFSICKRKYYYHYYGKYDPQVPMRLIQELKELSAVPLATGIAVHTVIQVLLNRLMRASQDIDREQFFDFAYRRTKQLAESESFQEVYYQEREAVAVEDLYPKVQSCLENLLRSDRYRWLVEKAIETRDQWVIEPPGYGETRMDGLKAYFKVDFLFPIADQLHILDWKTGKKDLEKHRKQLVGYSAWASYHFEVGAEKVVSTIAYLDPQYEEVEEVFNAFDLEHFGIQVRAESEEMQEYCRDVEQNIPVEKSEFPLIDDPRICSHCEFRGLCFPEQYPIP